MLAQLSNLTGQGNAGTLRACFGEGGGAHTSHRCSWNILGQWEKELDLSLARLQDKIGRNKGIQWKLTRRPVWGFYSFFLGFGVWVVPYIPYVCTTLYIFKELLLYFIRFEPCNYWERLEGQIMLPPCYVRKNKTQSGHMAGDVARKLWLLDQEPRPPIFQSSCLYTLLKLRVYLVNDKIESCNHICQKPTVS